MSSESVGESLICHPRIIGSKSMLASAGRWDRFYFPHWSDPGKTAILRQAFGSRLKHMRCSPL